jgi:hypothetical protein
MTLPLRQISRYCQLHVPDPLTLGNELPVPTEYKAKSAPQLVWTFWRREKCLVPACNQTWTRPPPNLMFIPPLVHRTWRDTAAIQQHEGDLEFEAPVCDLHMKLKVAYILYSWQENKRKGKGTGRGNVYTMKAYRQCGSTAPCIPHLSARRR